MQNLSHNIEKYILDLLESEPEDFISLRRKDLAEMFACVPSQINYVLRSRFTPEQGYLIESRRGEYGYIKILRIKCERPEEKAAHLENIIGNSISLHDAEKLLKALQNRNFITLRERLLISIALRSSEENGRGKFRLTHRENEKIMADILLRMLNGLILTENED